MPISLSSHQGENMVFKGFLDKKTPKNLKSANFSFFSFFRKSLKIQILDSVAAENCCLLV